MPCISTVPFVESVVYENNYLIALDFHITNQSTIAASLVIELGFYGSFCQAIQVLHKVAHKSTFICNISIVAGA